MHRVAGWSWLNLNEAAKARSAFETAQAKRKPDDAPSTDLLAGLAISQWLTLDKNSAITTYRELIEAGRVADAPEDWADPKTITDLKWPKAESEPLEAVRTATLEKFPELAPQPTTDPTGSDR